MFSLSALSERRRARSKEAGARWRRPAWLPDRFRAGCGNGIALGAATIALFAIGYALLLNVPMLRGRSDSWRETMFHTNAAFYADCIALWVICCLLWAVIGRLSVTIGIVTPLVVLITTVNQTKLRYRLEPLFPSDRDFLAEPSFLLSMVPLSQAVLGLIALLLLGVGLAVGIGRLSRPWRRRWSELTRGERVVRYGVRGTTLILAGLLVAQMAAFNEPGNPWRALYESRNGPDWRPWSQDMNYLANGFVGGFLYNMPVDPMARPAHHTEAELDAIVERHTAAATRINATRTGSLADTNVVLVLSESFSDPFANERFTLDRDPIPFTRDLMGRTWSGSTLGGVFGGGTANMEFEALTGQAISLFNPQLHSPYQMLVPEFDAYPSVVGALRSEGHRAVAVHPYNRSMYKRQAVYESLGFDEFIDERSISSTATIDDNPHISDAAAFDEVVRQIDDADDPLVLNLVTMQNHAPYADIYSDPIGVHGSIGPWYASVLGNYLRGLEHTDAALEDFLADLGRQDEDTIVLFYGDHLPGGFPDEVVGTSLGSAAYRTPFFLWDSNESQGAGDLEAASPGFFLPLLYSYADAPVSPYLALLQQFHDEVGSLQRGRVVAHDGTPIDPKNLTARQQQLLDDLRHVQYDVAMGGWYAQERMWPGATGPR